MDFAWFMLTRHRLKPLDIEIMKRLGTRGNLIPVIAKADTRTQNDLYTFKQRIRQVIQAQGIRIYQPPIEMDDEVSAEHARVLSEAMPFSIIGSTEDVTTPDGRTVKGREYLWGVAEVENENHCDFRKLRSLLIRTYMLDLISSTEELHYENYRQAQMETRKFGEQKPRKFENPKFKEEEEALRKRFTEQVKAEEARFRQWEQHVRVEGVLECAWVLTRVILTAYCGARPSQQGPRDGPQRDQGVGGGAGQPAGWVRTRDGQTVNGRSDGVGLLDWIRFYGTLCRFVTFVRYLTYTPSVSIYTGPSYVPVPFVAPFVAIYSHNRRTRRRSV